jgi:hypothetical protein
VERSGSKRKALVAAGRVSDGPGDVLATPFVKEFSLSRMALSPHDGRRDVCGAGNSSILNPQRTRLGH